MAATPISPSDLGKNTRQAAKNGQIHTFIEQVAKPETITHLRFNIFPKGCVSRLRLWGKVQSK